MQKVKLQILAKDILESDYTHINDCAITRALHRAGLTDFWDGVNCVRRISPYEVVSTPEVYRPFAEKVWGMYKFVEAKGWNDGLIPIEPTDFEYEITLNI